MAWRFWERDRTRHARVGLVLSGGGARASFQIGALTYLYERVGIAPQVITGTSAGSILAGALAQAGDAAGQRQVLAALERVWRDMQHSSDMFEELEWFATLREHGPGWVETFNRRRRRQDTLGRSFARVANRSTHRLGLRIGELAALPAARGWGVGGQASGRGGEPGPGAEPGLSAGAEPGLARSTEPDPSSGRNLGDGPGGGGAAGSSARPGRTLFGEEGAEQPQEGWNPLNVLELISVVREAGRARPELETIVRGAVRERSMYRPGPIVDRLLDPAVFLPQRVATSGITLRVAVVGLESGELRYVTETGVLVDRENVPVPGAAPVPLTRAILASCSIPTVFAPVLMGEEHYVDGGVRETLPTEIAIEHLAVDTCYAIVASPPGVPRQEGFADKDMLSVVVRTTAGIMSDEGLRDEVAYAHAAGAVVIQPEVDVHDVLTIDPGLTSISMDYGYMRAAEAHERASASEEQLTRDIVMLRKRIWAAEEELLAPADGVTPDGGTGTSGGVAQVVTHASARTSPAAHAESEPLAAADGGTRPGPIVLDPERLAALVDLKRRLRALVDQAPADRLPPGAQDWWRTWEGHPWEVPVRPDWS